MMSEVKIFDIQLQPNPFLSFGIHIDHRHPYITIHLPLVIIALGRIPIDQFAFQYSLQLGKQYDNVDGVLEWHTVDTDDFAEVEYITPDERG